MNIEDLKQKIKLALTENPDKKITPAELESAILDIAHKLQLAKTNRIVACVCPLFYDFENCSYSDQGRVLASLDEDVVLEISFKKQAYMRQWVRLIPTGSDTQADIYYGYYTSYGGGSSVEPTLMRVDVQAYRMGVIVIRQYPAELRLQDVYLDDKQGVVPFRHPDLSTQPSILPFRFAGNYVYEQMVWINSADIEAGYKKLDIAEGVKPERLIIVDIKGSGQTSAGCESVDVGAKATEEGLFVQVKPVSSEVTSVWVRVQYCENPEIGNYYYYAATERQYIEFVNNSDSLLAVSINSVDGQTIGNFSINPAGSFILEGANLKEFLSKNVYLIISQNVTIHGQSSSIIWYSSQPFGFTALQTGWLSLYSLFAEFEAVVEGESVTLHLNTIRV